jgi:hypothetical protein
MSASHNPPAFPNDARIQLGDDYQGMTLRDYFAGQALVAGVENGHTYEIMASRCYEIADAMIAERAKVQS